MTAAKFKATDMRFPDDIFESDGGWILDFSNRTFAESFKDELDVNIDDPRWYGGGNSKDKRLRCFLRNNKPEIVVNTLLAIIWALHYPVARTARSYRKNCGLTPIVSWRRAYATAQTPQAVSA